MSRHRRKYHCKWCGKEITFNDHFKSKNDKAIPLNLDETPHNCAESPYNKRKKQSVTA